MNCGLRINNGGGSKTNIEPATRRFEMSLSDYLDHEEIEVEKIPFEYSDLTKKLVNQFFLDFYYFVRGNKEEIQDFLMLTSKYKI